MQIDKVVLTLKYKTGAIILQNTQLSHSDQRTMVWQKTRITGQWNWTESPENLNTSNESEENREQFWTLKMGKELLNNIPYAEETKGKLDKWLQPTKKLLPSKRSSHLSEKTACNCSVVLEYWKIQTDGMLLTVIKWGQITHCVFHIPKERISSPVPIKKLFFRNNTTY